MEKYASAWENLREILLGDEFRRTRMEVFRTPEHFLGLAIRRANLNCLHIGQAPTGFLRHVGGSQQDAPVGGKAGTDWQPGWARSLIQLSSGCEQGQD